MSVTVKDVARMAGVSTATVSRVINDDPRISRETSEKVKKCISDLDYRVNNIARSLKTSRTYTIGFIAPEITNDFFMSIAKGVEDESRKYGYSIIVCNSNESIKEEEDRIRLLSEKCVDGIIIIPASDEGKHFNHLKELNMPVVLVDRLVNNFESDAVLVDNINGTYSAIEYLINMGHGRIGFISGDLKLTSAMERYQGYKRALSDYCIPYDEKIVKFGDFHIRGGYDMMKKLCEADNPPSAVFISNYFMHVGATKYLMEEDINKGKRSSGQNNKNIIIASFDDMELSTLLGFCKLRVAQPMMEIGSKAAQLLLGRINNDFERINNDNDAAAGDSQNNRVIRLKTRLVVNQQIIS
ncbi:MAG TPA: LacI family DNA-binding transcriptional regulator [Clostridiales bacterium]|nr:LacI family DNA-binding transcriptional regulator [Clostridiales bacterium]